MRWVLLRRLNCEYSGGKKTQMRGSYSRTCIPLSDFSLQHGTALCTIFASLERLAAAKHGYPAAPRKCYEGCTEVKQDETRIFIGVDLCDTVSDRHSAFLASKSHDQMPNDHEASSVQGGKSYKAARKQLNSSVNNTYTRCQHRVVTSSRRRVVASSRRVILIPRINAMHRYSPLALSPAAVVPVI
jgi:hypothetical protein